MFFHSCSYKNNFFSEFGPQLQCPWAYDLHLQRFPQKSCFGFCAFCFEGLLLVYTAYPLRYETIDLLFINKILVFETDS